MSAGTTGVPAAPQNPWPGLAPYTEQQHELFFGREAETEELLRLIQRETLTVLFGRSGSGKSSLLHAGVIPQMRSGMYFPVLIRLDFANSGADPVEQIKAITLAAAAAAGLDVDSRIKEGFTPTLWDFFHQTDFWGPRNDRLTPLLIFDQFEEAFTIGKDQGQASGFLEQLADLAENRVPLAVEQRVKQSAERLTVDTASPTYKIVLSLREDFVSRLDQLRPILPAIMRNRMALLPLDGARALEVILNSGRPWVSETVAQEIVAALAGETGASGEAVANAVIEPAYLSVMCHELFRRMVELGQDDITSELVAKERGEILEATYERSLEGLPESVRMFVEDRLVTASGFRGTVPLNEALAEGVSLQDLGTLVDRRLLRFEDRLGTRHVELSHDLLTVVVKSSRALRAARVAREKEERKQRELRGELIRARRRVIFALATALLALAGVAYSAYYWLAYIRPTVSYYRSFADQLGKITPFGELSLDAVHHRKLSYMVTRAGFRGQMLSMEVVDNNGSPTILNGLSTTLNFDIPSINQSPTDRYCCLEFEYDKGGDFVFETAWNQNHQMVWGEIYVPSQGQTSTQQVLNDIHFGPDGLPKPERLGSKAEIIQVDHQAQGHVTWKYLSWNGKSVPGPDNAYGEALVYDAEGRETQSSSLDANGKPMIDANGNATTDTQYDSHGDAVATQAFDAMGRPTLYDTPGYYSTTTQFDQWGRETEQSFFDVDGSPVLNKSVGMFSTRYTYDDRGNNLEEAFFDAKGNPMDKSVAPAYQRIEMQYNNANQIVRATYFDHTGKPVAGYDGQFDIRLKYDSLGDVTEIGYFDDKGQPALSTEGIHLLEQTFNSSGQELSEAFLGIDSKPVNGSQGFQSAKMTEDETGLINWVSYYDLNGNPANISGYYQEQFLRDQTGNVTKIIYTKTPGSALSYAIEQITYDQFSNPLKTCFYNADSTPAIGPRGVSCTVDVCDDRGLKIRETNFDKSGKLTADSNGYAHGEFSYNDKRQVTSVAYFGLNGPADGPNFAPPLTETQYDTAGHVTEVKTVDIYGDVTTWQFNAQGQQTGQTYVPAARKPVTAPQSSRPAPAQPKPTEPAPRQPKAGATPPAS